MKSTCMVNSSIHLMMPPTLSDLPTEILFKIYTRLPFGTEAWCRRTLHMSRLPLAQICMYITFRSSIVLSHDASVRSARSLASRIDLTDATAGAAFQQFGHVLSTYDWHTLSIWNRNDIVYSNPLTHAVIELILTCQRQNRSDLMRCLCASDENIPPDAIDVSTAIGQQIVDKNASNETAMKLISAAFSRCDDVSALAVLDRPIFAQETLLTNNCAHQAFYFGRIDAFRELIENPRYHLDRQLLDTGCRQFNSQYSTSPVASAGIFVYCVENAVLFRNIWNYVSIWNEMPRIAAYVALHPTAVPDIGIAQTWRFMRLAIGRLAPNVVAKILIDLSVNLEDLWTEKLAPFIMRCPHIYEDIEAHLWAYLLAGGTFNQTRLKRTLCKIESGGILQQLPRRNSLRWRAVHDRLNMLIAEIAIKYQLYYQDTDNLEGVFIERKMWWPTSAREDVDYW